MLPKAAFFFYAQKIMRTIKEMIMRRILKRG